jgi:putative efflux protein, MATE family
MFNTTNYKEHYKQIIRLGVPIMLGQLGIIIVGFADNIMVGHHSMEELAAASFVNSFFSLAFIFGMGFSYGLTPIIGSLTASQENHKIGAILKNSLFINTIIGLFIIVCMSGLLLSLDSLNQPEELKPLITPYFLLQLASIPFVMLFNSFKQFSEGTGDSLTPMWVMIATNIINIIGNYMFIYGNWGVPEMGLVGAGAVTLFIRILSLVVLWLLFAHHKRYNIYKAGFNIGTINRQSLKHLFRLGFPVSIQMGVETASFSLSVIMMGWISSIALAAHQIAGVITTVGFMIYYGIAAAVAIRVSMYKEWKDMKNVRYASFAGLHIILGVAAFVIILVFICRNFMGYLFTDNIMVVEAVALLAYPVILYQTGDGLQILFANALRGISDVKYLAYAASVCHFGLALPIGYICGFILDWGIIGIWAGFPVSLTTLGILLWNRFNKLTQV